MCFKRQVCNKIYNYLRLLAHTTLDRIAPVIMKMKVVFSCLCPLFYSDCTVRLCSTATVLSAGSFPFVEKKNKKCQRQVFIGSALLCSRAGAVCGVRGVMHDRQAGATLRGGRHTPGDWSVGDEHVVLQSRI